MASDTASGTSSARFFTVNAALLEKFYSQSGAARWEVSREEFAVALQRVAAADFAGEVPDGQRLQEYLGALHLSDLALACALRKGSAAAWEEFIRIYRPLLYAAARAIVGSAGEACSRELADSLYADLYGLSRDGAKRPLLDYFHGRSKLSTWLRTVLAQRHIDALRASHRTESLSERVAPAVPGRAQSFDPDRARLIPRLRTAISAAIAAASAGDRLLLALYYLRGMKLAQIAQLQKVHEATISRQLERIRRELLQKVEELLLAGHTASNGTAAQPGLSPAEVQQCLSYALEDWSFDLSSALGSSAIAPQETDKS